MGYGRQTCGPIKSTPQPPRWADDAADPKRSRDSRAPGLRLILAALILGLAFGSAPAPLAAQNSTHHPAADVRPDLKPFLGTWKASFGGKVFAILVFKEDRGDLAGTLNNFDLGWDKNGNLDDDTHIDFGNGPIFNVQLRDGYVYFIAVQKDDYSPSTEWRFIPKNAKEGELTRLIDGKPFLLNGVVTKPILMRRESSKP